MSYSARRLHRTPLRPRLRSTKPTQDVIKAEDKNVSSGISGSGDSTIISAQVSGQRKNPRADRLALPIRPIIREILASATGPSTLEGAWVQTPTLVRSSASSWGLFLVILICLVWVAGFVIGFQAALAVLLGVGLVLTIAGFVSPTLGLLAIGMVSALDAMANIFLLTGGLFRYNTLNYFLVLVILVNIPFILRFSDLPSRALQILLLLMMIELSFSKDISNGVQDILNIGATFGIAVYFARALKDELSLYWLGIVNGVLSGLGGLVFYLQMNNLPYANPNDWTYFQMTGLFSISIAYITAIKQKKNRLVLLFLAVLNFAWIFLSGSRGSLLVALLSLAFLFLSTSSITWKTVMVVIVVCVGIWVSANFAEQQITTVARVQELFDPTISAARRTSERSVIADAGWQVFQKNPMGIGTGSFEQVTTNADLLTGNRPPHSAWIQVLVENGVLGIIAMTIFVGSFAIVGLSKRSEGKLLFALFITLVLASAFIAKEFRGKSLWFLVASGIVLLQPRTILAYLNDKAGKQKDADASQRVRRVRFGQKR